MEKPAPLAMLPPIPPKRYFAIGEVALLCDVKPYVLRFWEQEFPQLRPSKRINRRYYTREDIELVRHIRDLLYGQLFTIKGARAVLEGASHTQMAPDADDRAIAPTQTLPFTQTTEDAQSPPIDIHWLRRELRGTLEVLDGNEKK